MRIRAYVFTNVYLIRRDIKLCSNISITLWSPNVNIFLVPNFIRLHSIKLPSWQLYSPSPWGEGVELARRMRWAAGGFYTQADSYLRLPFRGGGTALAVTEGLSVEARQKLLQSYGQLLRREPKKRRQFHIMVLCKFRRANTVRPYRDNSTVQLFYGTSRTSFPTICADNLRLLKLPSD